MGRATILSEHGEGKYRIKLEADKAADVIAAMTEQRERDLARKIELAVAINDALAAALEARNHVLEAIDAWLAGGVPVEQAYRPTGRPSQAASDYIDTRQRELAMPPYLTDAIRVREETSAALAAARTQYAEIEARLESTKLHLESIERVYRELQTPRDAWCADYTEGLTGVVATIEPPGDPDTQVHAENVNIAPGGAAPGAAYGALQVAPALSPAGFAWNLAMLAPTIKWKPKWRYGWVLGKNDDGTLHIAFDPVDPSSGRWLGADRSVNDPWQDAKQRVRVQYMNCHAAAFEKDDAVIVEWIGDEPVVVGFRREPKMCGFAFDGNTINVADNGRAYMDGYGTYIAATNDLRLNPSAYVVTMNGVGLVASGLTGGGIQFGGLLGRGIYIFQLRGNDRFYMRYRNDPPFSWRINLRAFKDSVKIIDMDLISHSRPSTTGGDDVLNVSMTCRQASDAKTRFTSTVSFIDVETVTVGE